MQEDTKIVAKMFRFIVERRTKDLGIKEPTSSAAMGSLSYYEL